MYKGLTARVTLVPSCFGNVPAAPVLQPSCSPAAFPATIQTLRPFPLHLIALQSPTFLPFCSYCRRYTDVLPRGANSPQFVHGSLDKLGIIFVSASKAQAALHKEWWSGKVGNVTMVRVYRRGASLCTGLYSPTRRLQIVPEMSKDPWTNGPQIVPKMSKGYPIV